MEKEQIESESKIVAEYFEERWPNYANINFDKTFSLRNWATIMAALVLHYNKGRFNKKIFKNKKILHIGCGYGYFLEVIKSLNAVPFGIEPYCSFPESLNITKARVEELQDNNSELSRILNNEKFNAIVAHDLFLFSILINKENAHKIIKSLKKYLNKKGVMVFENMNEETLLEKDEIEKLGFKAEYTDNIANPYGRICSQIIIRNKI